MDKSSGIVAVLSNELIADHVFQFITFKRKLQLRTVNQCFNDMVESSLKRSNRHLIIEDPPIDGRGRLTREFKAVLNLFTSRLEKLTIDAAFNDELWYLSKEKIMTAKEVHFKDKDGIIFQDWLFFIPCQEVQWESLVIHMMAKEDVEVVLHILQMCPRLKSITIYNAPSQVISLLNNCSDLHQKIIKLSILWIRSLQDLEDAVSNYPRLTDLSLLLDQSWKDTFASENSCKALRNIIQKSTIQNLSRLDLHWIAADKKMVDILFEKWPKIE